jgi:hypothetical protein
MSNRREISKPPSYKVLLVAPFWSGDQAQMMVLLKLLADTQPGGVSPLADLLLVNRFDCPPMHPKFVQYLARKFHVFTHNSVRKGTGWPCGYNSLAFSSVEWFYSMSAEKPGIPRYKAAFLLEADTCPLDRNWLQILSAQWDQFKGKVCVAGVKVASPHVAEHINGNCFLSGNLRFLHWLARRVSERTVGWDYALAKDFRAWGAAEMPRMEFHWKTPNMTDEHLQSIVNRGVVWLHGVKDFSALQFAKRTIL